MLGYLPFLIPQARCKSLYVDIFMTECIAQTVYIARVHMLYVYLITYIIKAPLTILQMKVDALFPIVFLQHLPVEIPNPDSNSFKFILAALLPSRAILAMDLFSVSPQVTDSFTKNHTPSKGWCLNPKHFLNGTPYDPFGTPWRVQVHHTSTVTGLFSACARHSNAVLICPGLGPKNLDGMSDVVQPFKGFCLGHKNQCHRVRGRPLQKIDYIFIINYHNYSILFIYIWFWRQVSQVW